MTQIDEPGDLLVTTDIAVAEGDTLLIDDGRFFVVLVKEPDEPGGLNRVTIVSRRSRLWQRFEYDPLYLDGRLVKGTRD